MGITEQTHIHPPTTGNSLTLGEEVVKLTQSRSPAGNHVRNELREVFRAARRNVPLADTHKVQKLNSERRSRL